MNKRFIRSIFLQFSVLLLFTCAPEDELIDSQKQISSNELAASEEGMRGQIPLTEEEKAWLETNPTVAVRISNSPPFHFLDRGYPAGYSVELMDRIAAVAGFNVQYVSGIPWPDALDKIKLQNGEVDLLLTVKNTEERRDYIGFTSDYIELPFRIFTRADDNTIRSMSDLAGKTVAVEKGYAVVEQIRDQYPRIKVIEVDGNTPEALRQVSSGGADAYIGILPIANYHIVSLGIANMKTAGLTTFGFHTQAFGVRKDWPELTSILNKALTAISLNERRELQRKWGLQELLREPEEADAPTPYKKHFTFTQVIRGPVVDEAIRKLDSAYSELGYTVDFVFLEGDEVLESTDAGLYDGEMFRIAGIQDSYPNLMPVPVPFIVSENVLFARSDWSTDIAEWDDLASVIKEKKRIGLRSSLQEGLRQLESRNLPYTETDTIEEAMILLSEGEIDLVYEERLSGREALGRLGIEEITILEPPLSQLPLYHYLHRDNSFLIPQLTDVFVDMFAEGLIVDAVEPVEDDIRLDLTPEEKAWLNENPEITLGFTSEMPPLLIEDVNGEHSGILIYVYDEVESLTGLKVNIILGEVTNVLQKARDGEIDGLLAISPGRVELIGLIQSKPIGIIPPVFFARYDASFNISSLEDIEGKKIAVLKGVLITQQILEPYMDVIEVIETTSALVMLNMVIEGKVDLAFGMMFDNYLINRHSLLGIQPVHIVNQPQTPFVAAVKTDWPEFVSIMNKGLDAMGMARLLQIQGKWIRLEMPVSEIVLTEKERTWLVNHPDITLGIDEKWAPWIIKNPDGTFSGIDADIIELLNRRLGTNMSFEVGRWPDMVGKLENKEIDGLSASAVHEERRSFALFTDPYASNYKMAYIRYENPKNITSPDDLAGKRIAVPEGNLYIEKLLSDYSDVTLMVKSSAEEMLEAVLSGEADVLIGSETTGYKMAEQGIDLLKPVFMLGDPLQVVFSVRNDWPELVSILNKGIATISEKEWLDIKNSYSELLKTEELIISDQILFEQTARIIKWVAGVIAVLIALMFFYWLLQGRPKQFSIRLTLFYISVGFTGLIVLSGILVLMLLQGEQRQEEVEKRKYHSIQLAYELKQSSDDLTRFARAFVATGELEYEQYFRAIIRIRDGEQAHPRGFSFIYWDQITSGLTELDDTGEIYSIEQRMRELGLSEKELEKLMLAKIESDNLINLEDTAMNAARGIYIDDKGQFTLKGDPDPEMANQLLYGEEYYFAKVNIMNPINDFFILLDQRTENELQTERSKNRAIMLVITGLIGLTIIYIVLVFFIFQKRLVNPIQMLKHAAKKLETGDYTHHITIGSQDEFGNLGGTFNDMVDSISDRNQRLQESESKYHTLFEGSRDAILIGDENGFLEANPAALQMFGIKDHAEFLTKRPADLSPPIQPGGESSSDLFKKNETDVRENGEAFFEWVHRRSDGTDFTAEVLLFQMEYKGKSAYQGVIRDITERKKAEAESKREEKRVQSLYEISTMVDTSEKEICEFALEAAVEITASQVGYLNFYDRESSEIELYLWPEETYRYCTVENEPHYKLELAGVWADCIRTGEPAIHNDYQNLPDKKGLPEGHFPIIRHLSVPLVDNSQIVAVCGVGNKESNYDSRDIKQLQIFIHGMWNILSEQRSRIQLRNALEETDVARKKLEAFNEKLADEIKERKKAEEALQKINQMLVMAEGIGVMGSWEWDIQTNKVSYSDNAFKLYGIKPEEYNGEMELVFYVLHPEDRGYVQKNIEEALAEKKPRSLEYRIIKPDGEIRIISSFSQMFFDDNGEVIKMVGHLQDITEQKKAEKEILNSRDLLNKAQNIGHMGHWILDPFTMEIEGSDELFRIFGLTRDEATLEAFAEVVHPEDREYDLEHIQRGMETGESWDIEHRIVRKDGSEIVVRAIGHPLVDSKGNVVQLLGIVQDITEQKKSENELKSTLNQLKETQSQLVQSEKMASLGFLAAGVAHEINNPVNFIQSSAYTINKKVSELLDITNILERGCQEQNTGSDETSSLLTDCRSLEEKSRGLSVLTENILTGTERISEIVRSLQMFSRVDRSSPEYTDIHEGLDSTILLLSHRIMKKVELVREYGDVPRLICYPGRLNQVFMNLLGNALDSLENDGVKSPAIVIETQIDNSIAEPWVMISIIDNGTGFQEKSMEHIFEPFYTTKAAGRGTGLGLSISLGIVEQHGGTITAENNPAGGARLIIRLPIFESLTDWEGSNG